MYVYDGNRTDHEMLVTIETGWIQASDIESVYSDMIIVFTSDFFEDIDYEGFQVDISFARSRNYQDNVSICIYHNKWQFRAITANDYFLFFLAIREKL